MILPLEIMCDFILKDFVRIQIYRRLLCVADLVGFCTRYSMWGRRMLVKYRCLPLSSILACINYTGQYLMLLQVSSVSYMYSHHALSVPQDHHLLWCRGLGLLPSCKDQGCISCTPRCPPAGLWDDGCEGSQGLLGRWILGARCHFLI